METVAAVQIQALDHLGDLRAAGCLDLGVARMRRLTEEFLGPNGPVRGGRVQGLDPHHTAYLLDGAEGLVRAWDALAAFGIPDSFEHGDFRPGHVVVHDGAVRFFDLADAAIAHPFFSAVTMLDFEPLPDAVGGSAAELKAALCRSYLGPVAAKVPAGRRRRRLSGRPAARGAARGTHPVVPMAARHGSQAELGVHGRVLAAQTD